MNNKIMETLETLEDRLESIKWLVTVPSSLKGAGVSETINTIRKTAGILSRDFPKGIAFENKVRRGWETNFLKRTD